MKSYLHTIVPALLTAIVLIGCDVPTSSLVETGEAADVHLYSESFASADLTTVLSQELELSSMQQASLQVEMQRRDRPEKTPGSLWFVSARLQDYLSERQKEKLFALAQRSSGEHLRKLVGVYHPCMIGAPVDAEQPEQLPIRLIVDALTDAQLEAAENIRSRFRDQVEAIRRQVQAGELSREEAARLLRQLHETLAAEIRQLLTADQIAALRERVAARGDRVDAHSENGRRAMIAALDLDRAQVDALDELHREQCAGLETLVRLARAGELSREEFREGLERLVAAKHEAYARILDDAQFEIAKIHDALLVIHARRFIHHVTDAGAQRPTDDDPQRRTANGVDG